jgi:type II secretion system protein N
VALTDAGGLRIPVDRLDAWLEPLPLLLGKRAVGFRAAVFEGAVEGRADLSGASRRVTAQLRGVELARILPLRRAAGVGFLGRANGHVDLTLPGGLLEKASGAVELGISQAGMASGQVPIPGMASGLNLPALSFGAMSATAKLDQGRVAVDRLEAKGGDAELTTEGVAFVLQPRLEFAPLTGRARIRFQAGLWQKPEAAPLRPVVEAGLASSKAGDGSYGLLLSGNLGHPQIRPGTGGPATPPAAGSAAAQ